MSLPAVRILIKWPSAPEKGFILGCESDQKLYTWLYLHLQQHYKVLPFGVVSGFLAARPRHPSISVTTTKLWAPLLRFPATLHLKAGSGSNERSEHPQALRSSQIPLTTNLLQHKFDLLPTYRSTPVLRKSLPTFEQSFDLLCSDNRRNFAVTYATSTARDLASSESFSSALHCSPKTISRPHKQGSSASARLKFTEEMDPSKTPDKSGGKRRLFGFGKKKDAEKGAGPTSTPAPLNAASLQSSSPPNLQPTTSPGRSPRIPGIASPSERYRSSSPRMHSPASSQIFERNVQESTLPGELSPAIPAHITTEDHIPPALEASTIAITDDHLNPDDVQIVTHSAHQPASAAVSGTPHESMSLASPASEELAPPPAIPLYLQDEAASNYSSFDTGDPRRLSFISFADVVQAEHAEDDRDAMNLMSLSSTTNHSPSPIRSPASSHNFSPSPPTSVAASVQGLDHAVKAPGSPTTAAGRHSPTLSGELNIETMRQALRKTRSGDLSGSHVQPVSPVSADHPNVDQKTFR